jgi:glucose/arabinose dehydrogenase
MKYLRWIIPIGVLILAAWILNASNSEASNNIDSKTVLTGQDAFADSMSLKPGKARKITPADLPKPYATESARVQPLVARPEGAMPIAPAGFKVELFLNGLKNPRQIRMAPNGDLFFTETNAGEIKIIRGYKDGKPETVSVFATGLAGAFGIAFYPLGNNPQWLYVGNTQSLVRIPYRNGDLEATGPAETLVDGIPRGGHSTRDVVFSKDGKRLFLAVGSASNVDDPDEVPREFHRANILEYTPEGKFLGVYASGIRNPVGLGINPTTGELWCSVNERDALGDNLVPDYITHVQEGGFYGWPWYYMGANQDPRHAGKHPELKDKVIVPDVLMQPHNASLGLTFYEGTQFPKEYRGDLFAAEHGSWNRAKRAGLEVVRVPLDNGHASGVYQDFLTGFTTADGTAWGRPVGVAVAKDGSMYVTDDGSKSIWRVSHPGK